MATVTIRTGKWCGDKDLPLRFPDNWQPTVYESQDPRSLSDPELESALDEPIGSRQIEQLATGKQTAAIIVDDLSRPTPAHEVIPHVLKRLKAGGIRDDSIRFVVGGGAHRPLTQDEIAKKVGKTVAATYEVHNHNVFSGNLQGMGNLEDGTPVYINDVVARSELKIGIGGITLHPGAGFGGGGKIVAPGIAGYTTIAYNHGLFKGRARGSIEREGTEKDIRENAEDIARHVGLDLMVNVVFNGKSEIAGLYAGKVVEAHRQGATFAKQVYDTVIPSKDVEETDIVVINAYPQDYDPVQMGKSLWPSKVFDKALKVIIDPASDGIFYHGMSHRMDYGRFLRTKAREPQQVSIPAIPKIASKDTFVLLSSSFPKALFYSRYTDGALFETWNDVVDQLGKLFDRANVAVIPYAPIQLPSVV